MTDFKDKKVFIAGPMRGYEKYNFPKFDRIEKILKDNGVDCVNPSRISRKFKEKDVNSDINVYNEMVRLQQEAERTCDAILLLDGWQHSKGVALEVKTAADLGMQFLLESDLPREWLELEPELADWHDDLIHDIVVADMMRGASPEEAVAFGQFAEECLAELVSDELKAEIDRQMIGLLKQNKK